ncbi:MAG: hypothetical protein RIF39_17725, partial [Cyclobacteriaceae bacterium]
MSTKRILSGVFSKTNLLIILFTISIPSAWAQFKPLERYEKEVKLSDNNFTIIPLDQNGIALVREKNKYNSGNRL